MLFYDVAQSFVQIEATSSRLTMTHQLANLLRDATPSEASIICNISLGQLNPPYIGTQFNIAEKTMVKIIAELLDKSESTVHTHAKKLGDLGSVAEEGTWRTRQELTVHQVYKALH